MKDFDHLQLDGRLLQVLVTVVEESSVTRAAERLGVTQSAVSHLLQRLRDLVGDPLVVKSGRGIVPTARAEALARRARGLLEDLQRFVQAADFDPAGWRARLTIAANDLQRDLLLPALLERLAPLAPGLTLRVVPSGAPTLAMLRDQGCDLVISPRPPDGADIVHKRLFEDRWRVFYDAAVREPPRSLGEYLAADHVTVAYEPPRQLDIDHVLAARGIERRFVVMVPGFAGVAPFLRGSDRLATLPGLLGQTLLRDLASAAVPVACPPMPMFLVWHLRHRHDPAHQWLRAQVEAVVPQALARARASAALRPPRPDPPSPAARTNAAAPRGRRRSR